MKDMWQQVDKQAREREADKKTGASLHKLER
jgi:hypothetical protein